MAVLGCIADDFTGATDLANALVRQGMRTLMLIGLPSQAPPRDVDALVVALKIRTVPAADAVTQALAAQEWLAKSRVRQVYFKYCSTFDSTPAGNIGPVADALLRALRSDFTIACPAFPGAGRTIYRGHLFVGDRLLSESSMKDHPLTPMTDADLVRVLGRQTNGFVGLATHPAVAAGPEALAARLKELALQPVRYAVVDAVDDEDLNTIAEAVADMALVTAGSGLAIGLPAAYRRRGWLPEFAPKPALAAVEEGPAVVLAGSCSTATLAQVNEMRGRHPAFELDPMELSRGRGPVVTRAVQWATDRMRRGPVLLYSSAEPAKVTSVQRWLGQDRAAKLVEDSMGAIARELYMAGARRFIVAGGETSGAVVQALGIGALRIGPEIDPGVPWTVTEGGPRIALALKSGNFGTPDFFLKALGMAP